jgi:hypothetical protein
MIYNEAYELRRKEEEALMKKWHKALTVNAVTDESVARTTAILLENYFTHLHDDPKLIAEDQIQTGAFTGVNLALLGLIARVIPNLIGLELVGTQAMPTPRAPIFTMKWYKSDQKGQTAANEEMWVSPVPAQYSAGIDPYYTSQQVKGEAFSQVTTGPHTLVFGNRVNLKGEIPLLFSSSMYMTLYSAAGAVLTVLRFTGDYNNTSYNITGAAVGSYPGLDAGTIHSLWNASKRQIQVYSDAGSTAATLASRQVGAVAVASAVIEYEYKPENEGTIPEMEFEITENYVDLIRRQLRGKYTLDAAFDLKKLHGIDLENELLNMMKQELMAEINREIVTDLRLLAAISKTIDFSALPTSGGTQMSVVGRWEDAHRALLDAIEKVCAVIWNVGRRGMGNFVVGNPETLSFLDRVPGFTGSGVTYNGRDLSFSGSLGGKIKFYSDPNYPKNELLIGYKGNSAIDSGYVYCPYLPITATPTLIDPETGNPSKLFYTRYGKTFKNRSASTGMPENLILMGEYQYARLTIANFPTFLA